MTLPPGEHRITFQGKYGTAVRRFKVKAKPLPIATAVRVQGQVWFSGKQGVWKSLKANHRIPAGFIVKTAADGFAEIQLDNGVVYLLKNGRSVRFLAGGRIAENLSRRELAVYSIVDPKRIDQAVTNLKPLIRQLERLLETHRVKRIEAENKGDVQHLLDLIFKGELPIEEISVTPY